MRYQIHFLSISYPFFINPFFFLGDIVAIVCEKTGNANNLSCPSGSLIHVSEAIYGRIDGGDRCGVDLVCASRKSFICLLAN